ncbi:MAG: DNA glycosylase AlkZ-like family protein [Candidatus Dormibacteria bacterium]
MERQGLSERAATDVAAAVSAAVGIQSQMSSAADLSVAARMATPQRGATDAALWEGYTVWRTWALRGTLHLLPAAEAGIWLGGLSGRQNWRRASWLRAFGISMEEMEALIDAIGLELAGEPLTRLELGAAVEERLRTPGLAERLQESWGALLKPAAYSGLLCHGPPRGRWLTFTRPDRLLGDVRRVDGPTALSELVRRFLTAHGPATAPEVARWWGVPPAQGRRLLTALADETTTVSIDGSPAVALRADVPALAAASPSTQVRLLPLFDVYTITGLTGAAVPLALRPLVSRTSGWISATVVMGGRVVGVWESAVRRGVVEVSVSWFRGARRPPRPLLVAEVERLGAYAGTSARLVTGGR